jgi:hypothetical protein
MARGKPLSAAHKAAISAGLKRYWATKNSGGSGGASGRKTQHIETGKMISREDAARIMFGTAGAAKKLAAGKRRRK